MNFKKCVTALLLIGIGVASIMLLKNNEGLKSWVLDFLPNSTSTVAEHELPESQTPPPKSTEFINTENFPPFPSTIEIPEKQIENPEETAVIMPTTIEGGMVLRNDTEIEVDLSALIQGGAPQILPMQGIQVLIIHTHGSESYTQDPLNPYEESDSFRTQDASKSIIKVGDELAASLESYGLNVIHDREIYDYPSYTGSYSRSGAAVEKYLSDHPEIAVVFDVHRDAIGSEDVVYKTVAEGDGRACSQMMLLVGTGENGLHHPNWLENMKLALSLQSAAVDKYPTLMRPISLKNERYNQQMNTGSLILEVGSSGNTLDEALQATRLFADAVAPALLKLVEE